METLNTLFWYQGIIAILFWGGLEITLLCKNKIPKHFYKNIKKRKKYAMILAIFFIFLGWGSLESLFSSITQLVFLSITTLLFWVLFIWLIRVLVTEHIRITRAIARRKAKEKK